MEKFDHIKVGDTVHRVLANRVINLKVGHIEDGIIHTGSITHVPVEVPWTEGWKFRVENGLEVDEFLGWDGIKTTGSFLTSTPEEYGKY